MSLWRIKVAINAANIPVHEAIYELAETKGLIAFLKGLDTKRGKAVVGFSGEAQEYTAQITAVDAQTEIEALESRLDALQDLLDAHNATAVIEFGD